MLANYLRHAAFAAAVIKFAAAQDDEIVPEDLREGFLSSTDVQVSFTGEAENGFQDGTEFEKDAVAEEPTFALGDSSAVVPRNRYTIVMVDTTCDDARTLHYARTNFKYNFDIVKIESETEAVLAYKAPGSFEETGDDRKYSFLMYGQPDNDEIDDLKLPEEGAVFDAKKFQDDNGFEDPRAGVGMVVKLGGESSCNGGTTPSNPGGEESSSAPASSAAATSEAATSEAATSEASGAATSVAQNSSAAATPTGSAAPSNGTAPQSTGASTGAIATGSASGLTTIAAPSGTGNELPGAVTSTLFLTSNGGAEATGSPTVSGDPAEQTTNGAPGLSFGAKGTALVASVMAIAGLLAW